MEAGNDLPISSNDEFGQHVNYTIISGQQTPKTEISFFMVIIVWVHIRTQ